MIRRIILDNYMAHAHTVIEPAAGLTVLVGPNNCGKSAIVHALQTLCYNKPAEFAVRHGEKEASVTVETDDGHVLTWRRRKGKVSYVIDGREVDRLGLGGVPDDLHRYLKMPRIDPPNEASAPFFVHFGLQKSPIFLLDDPPARAATFFATSSDAEKLLEMQKRHRDKVRDARRDHDRLAAEVTELDRRLQAEAPARALAERVARAEARHQELSEAATALARLRQNIDRLRAAERRREGLQRRLAAASPLAAPPLLLETAPLAERIRRIAQLASNLAEARRQVRTLQPLAQAPLLAEPSPLIRTIDDLRRTIERAKCSRSRMAVLRRLSTSPLLPETAPLAHAISRLRSAGERRGQLHRRFDRLTHLAAPPGVRGQEAAALAAFVGQAREAELRRSRAAREAESAAAALEALHDQVQSWVDANPQCPICGGATNAEAVLSLEHQHA